MGVLHCIARRDADNRNNAGHPMRRTSGVRVVESIARYPRPSSDPRWLIIRDVIDTSQMPLLPDQCSPRSARTHGPRTPEDTMHAVARVQGWPAALVVQDLFRHKSRKVECQVVSWITVALTIARVVRVAAAGVTQRSLKWTQAHRAAHNGGRMDTIPAGTWVVVADGTGARLLENIGKQGVSLRQKTMLSPVDLDHEGPSGVAPPEQTGQQTNEATFAKQLAHRLNAGALQHEYEHLVLVADPQTLGQIRPQLHQETRARLVGELAKTLTGAPLGDIERALS
jgi:protein required for attachment to host cells/uncharacterized membrane protein YsdA (DUF1294 family)